MIGKQNRDALYFCCIFENSAVSHIVYKKTQLGGWGRGVSSKSDRGVQPGGGACNGVWVHMQFDYLSSVFLFAWKYAILQTLRVKIYTKRFQELYRCCIRLQVFITLYQSNSGLQESLNFNFIQPQAMVVLALYFRFMLYFQNSRIRVQFCNKLTLCKVNIGLQTIISLR